MTLPNFIIIGAHKAGTSSIYEYLKEHPDVYMPSLKEARFFAYDESNPDHLSKVPHVFPIKTLDDYKKLFEAVRTEKAIGEASPEYLNSSFAATRIKEHIPYVKLIATLRNPIDRAYSLYLMKVRSGQKTESFLQTVRSKIESSGYHKNTLLYYDNIKTYMDLFGSTQLKIILFDDLKTNPINVMKDLFCFLDVDDNFIPDLSVKYNPGGLPKSKTLHTLYSNRKIKNLIKSFVSRSSYALARKLVHKNLAKPNPLPLETRIEMLHLFKTDVLRLQDLIQRDLSNWLQIEN